MTVLTPFLNAVEPENASQRAFRAGQLVSLLVQLTVAIKEPFVREDRGWRIRIERIGEHRAMEAEDIGLEPKPERHWFHGDWPVEP